MSAADQISHEVPKRFITKSIITSGYMVSKTGSGFIRVLKDSDTFAQCESQLINVISCLVEEKANKSFHSDLSTLEKMGFINKDKSIAHERYVERLKGGAALLASMGIISTLYCIDVYFQRRDFDKMLEFFISSLAYLTKTRTIPVDGAIKRIYVANSIKPNVKKIEKVFNKYIDVDVTSLPYFPNHDKNLKEDAYISVLTVADLSDEDVIARAQELGQYLGFRSSEVEVLINQSKDGTDFESIFSGFVGLSLNDFLSDLARSMDYARSAAIYAVENDPYRVEREKRKKFIIDGIRNISNIAPTSKLIVKAIYPSAMSIFLEVLGSDHGMHKAITDRMKTNFSGLS